MYNDTFQLALFQGFIETIVWAAVVIWGMYIIRPVLLAALT